DASSPATPTKYYEYKQSKSGTVTYQTLLYPVAAGSTATVQPKKLTMANTTDKEALAMEIAISDSSKPELAKLTHYHSFEDQAKERSFGSFTTNALTTAVAQNKANELFYASLIGGNRLSSGGKVILHSSHALEDLTAVLREGVLKLYSNDPQAAGCSFQVNFSQSKVSSVTLNGREMDFTQGSDGTVSITAPYLLLDFRRDDMAAKADSWYGLRSTTEVDDLKGTLSGTIDGGDPNIRMNSSCEDLSYVPKEGDILELRMKTTLLSGEAKGVQVFFLSGSNTAFSEAYSVKNMTLDHATGRYQLITLPLTPGAVYLGQPIHSLRVDMLHLSSQDSVQADYEIDYIYIGPKEHAPSKTAKTAQYLYFDFGNMTADKERYSLEAYGGYPFDLDNWAYNSNRTAAPIIDNSSGTLSIHIKDNNDFSYVQTTTAGNSLTAKPLYYHPHPTDRVQVRLRFEHCSPTSDKISVMLHCIRDNMEDVTNDHSTGYLTKEQVLSGEYVMVEFPVTELFGKAEEINSLRFTVGDVEDDGTGLSRIVFDYFYVGPKEYIPVGDHLYFGFDNTEKDRERYNTKTYGSYNFDTGCWGINSIRAKEIVMKENAMTIALLTGASGTYTQTTTGGNSMNTMPLTYFPKATDLVQVRLKFRNCTGTAPYVHLYYIKDDSATVTNDNSKKAFSASLLDADTYTVVTFPVPKGFGTAKLINSIRLTFTGLAEDGSGTGEILVDYLYVGSREGLPTPMYDVTFRNEDGSVLQTLTVLQGETAVYTGKTPTKAPDHSKHYQFKGWDKSLSNITANTVVTAQYNSASHSFRYSNKDSATHTASCSCGYSKTESHSYSYKATKNPTTSATGTLTGTCSKCNGTTTVTLPKLNTTDYTKSTTTAPTCTANGTDKYTWKTTTYGTFSFNATVAKLGHNHTATVTAPTCTAKGYTTHTCTRCGDTYTDTETAALGHAYT
ncbi:MAG: hypothetical protein II272_09330, partial [Oscillospiraceae bacterium]|nr:hypothetical protein [Oscillospiraceae bacterium]